MWRTPKIRRYGETGPHRRVHLVAPRHPESFWSLQATAELFGAKTLMPNAALATLMALTPEDVSVAYTLSDENVAPVDLDQPCDLVAITGGTLHAPRIRQLAQTFRSRGIPVALGGAYASLEPDRCDGLADHLFVGEAEYTWPQFLREWAAGAARPVYRQTEPVDLADSPAPDWSLIRASDYLNLTVQTGRGCPNRCDFCQVIQYLGRRVRTKSVAQVMTEVRNAHAVGARSVFFSDDNFLGRPGFTRDLLAALVAWNRRQRRPLSFATQITVQVADDEALLRRLADARFSVLFVGVETVRQACLEEVHKGQNLTEDPVRRLRRISRHGIVPFVGLIVGFDHDDETVFDELEAFVEQADCPIAGVSLLNAPRGTPLYRRLAAAGRIVEEGFGGEWQLATNVVPARMDPETLASGYWRLFERLYDPERFAGRLTRWLAQVRYRGTDYPAKRFDPRLLGALARMGGAFTLHSEPPVRRMVRQTLWRVARQDPRMIKRTLTLLAQYWHMRAFVQGHRPRPVARRLGGDASQTGVATGRQVW